MAAQPTPFIDPLGPVEAAAGWAVTSVVIPDSSNDLSTQALRIMEAAPGSACSVPIFVPTVRHQQCPTCTIIISFFLFFFKKKWSHTPSPVALAFPAANKLIPPHSVIWSPRTRKITCCVASTGPDAKCRTGFSIPFSLPFHRPHVADVVLILAVLYPPVDSR